MAYKTILLNCNDEQRFPGMLAAAMAIAKSNASHLIGLAIMPPIIIVPGSEAGAGTVIEDHRVQYAPHLARMREAFEAATRDAGIGAEWLQIDGEDENPFGDVARVAVAHARTADLVVSSAANPSWQLSGYMDVGEALVMDSGRPVLMLPRTPSRQPGGKRIMVAWNASREAARALFDALPLLQAADAVLVAQINENLHPRDVHRLPDNYVCKTLMRHGVHCEMLPPAQAQGGIGVELMQAAERCGADMMVMGCYGHSRMRELLLGGASRHILQHMHIPILMSH